MEEILNQHRQEFDEIRRLCLQCHGLDLTSSNIFSGSTYETPSDRTKSVLHSMLSSSLLNLAVSIRVNLYQGTIKNKLIPLKTMAADIYDDEELIIKEVTIKDVCDKIIHADSVSKPIIPEVLLEHDVKISFQLKGINRKKAWTLNLCLENFTESVLILLDEIESNG
ncbi:MAG: hypothetical protein RPU90_05100 [Candidatus Sedimenticola sp. (ex Thyasira tokunagai)]